VFPRQLRTTNVGIAEGPPKVHQNTMHFSQIDRLRLDDKLVVLVLNRFATILA